jgi:hypothetical protein
MIRIRNDIAYGCALHCLTAAGCDFRRDDDNNAIYCDSDGEAEIAKHLRWTECES